MVSLAVVKVFSQFDRRKQNELNGSNCILKYYLEPNSKITVLLPNDIQCKINIQTAVMSLNHYLLIRRMIYYFIYLNNSLKLKEQ